MAVMMNNNTNNATFSTELPNYTGLGDLKDDIMELSIIVYHGSVDFLLIVSVIMWAGIQQKVVSYLTATLAGMQWNPESLRYEPPNCQSLEDNQGPDETGNEVLQYIVCCLLHLSLYIGFVKSEIPIGSPPIQAITISLVPLLIPYRFYFEWPAVSKGFLMCWARIWLQDTHTWLICSIFWAVTVPCMLKFMAHALRAWGKRLADIKSEDQRHPKWFAEACLESMRYLKEVFPKLWRKVFWS